MVATLDRTVQYSFEINDNVLDTCHLGAEAQKKFDGAIKTTTNSITDQNISFIKAVAALGAFRHGMHSIAMGMEELGIINKKTNKTFYDAVAGIDLVVGAAMAYKGIVGLIGMMKVSLAGLAGVETYRKVLNNPAAIAAVMAGIGIAGGVAGYLIGQNMNQGGGTSTMEGGTNIEQNIYFSGTEPNYSARSASRSSLEGMGF